MAQSKYLYNNECPHNWLSQGAITHFRLPYIWCFEVYNLPHIVLNYTTKSRVQKTHGPWKSNCFGARGGYLTNSGRDISRACRVAADVTFAWLADWGVRPNEGFNTVPPVVYDDAASHVTALRHRQSFKCHLIWPSSVPTILRTLLQYYL